MLSTVMKNGTFCDEVVPCMLVCIWLWVFVNGVDLKAILALRPLADLLCDLILLIWQ